MFSQPFVFLWKPQHTGDLTNLRMRKFFITLGQGDAPGFSLLRSSKVVFLGSKGLESRMLRDDRW